MLRLSCTAYFGIRFYYFRWRNPERNSSFRNRAALPDRWRRNGWPAAGRDHTIVLPASGRFKAEMLIDWQEHREKFDVSVEFKHTTVRVPDGMPRAATLSVSLMKAGPFFLHLAK
jgi:hypothetical protein